MVLCFEDLPPEVITKIAGYLYPCDILSLAQCVDLVTTRGLYTRVFPHDAGPGVYDSSLFNDRLGAKLYLLRESSNSIEIVIDRQSVDAPISLVSSGWSFSVTTIKGESYVCLPETGLFDKILAHPSQNRSWRRWFRRYFRTAPRQSSWVDVCPSSNYSLAVDNLKEYLLWKQSLDGYSRPSVIILRCPSFGQWKLLEGKKSMLRVGYWADGCLVEGTGIAVWNNNSCLENSPLSDQQNVSKVFSIVNCLLVPGSETVRDYVIAGELALFIKADFTVAALNLRRFFFNNDEPFDPLFDTFNFDELNALAAEWGGFTRIDAFLNRIVLVAKNGKVVLLDAFFGTKLHPLRILAALADPLDGMASVSLGEREHLALSKDGHAYSWKIKDILWWNQTEMVGRFPMSDPLKLELPGRVYGVFAGQGYKGVLCGDQM